MAVIIIKMGLAIMISGIYLIQPKFPPSFWGMDYCRDLSGFKANFPPLNLMTLAALTPEDIKVTICDEHVELAKLNIPDEVVGISGYLVQKDRVFELAKLYKNQGKIVVIGGPIASLMPDECRKYADVLFEGESEYTWPQFIKDLRINQPEQSYCEHGWVALKDIPLPRLDLVKMDNYAQGIVQTSRGCPFNCEFCDISVMFGRKVRIKPLVRIMDEIKLWYQAGAPAIFFADDNFAGNRHHARELLSELVKLNQSIATPLIFHAQISVDVTSDEAFLGLMQAANFQAVFVGIETPRKTSLLEINKVQNLKVDLVQAIKIFQRYGMFVFAGMIVGFDNDDESVFAEIFDFVQNSNILLPMIGLLQALPKTPLFERLNQSGRIKQEFQPSNNHIVSSNIIPLKISYEQLCRNYIDLCKRLYSYEAFSKRLIGSLQQVFEYKLNVHQTSLRSILAGVRVMRYYLLTCDWRRRNFFIKTIYNTMQIKWQAIMLVIWYLGIYKHVSSFVENDLKLASASIRSSALEKLV